jgi:hypothetical protein
LCNNAVALYLIQGMREGPGVCPPGLLERDGLPLYCKAAALDAIAAAAIVIYVAVDVKVAVVVCVATAVIISAMADQDAGNVTTLAPPAQAFLVAGTQPPVVLPLVAVVTLLAPGLPVTLTEHVEVTVIQRIRVAKNFKET